MQNQDITPSHLIGTARLAIGLLQGLALYFLYNAAESKVWPATDGQFFAPLLLIALFLPLLVIQGLNNLRLRTLLIWSLAAASLLAFLGWYEIWHGWPTVNAFEKGAAVQAPRIIPDGLFIPGIMAMLFIGHALILGGDRDRRFRARYETHFDVSWTLGLQLALGVLFVAMFWGLLWLGASLFNLLKIDFFSTLLQKEWFSIPISALATAAALHLTDIRPTLIRGTRTLLLALLSWLLPLMALIVVGFLATLPFSGLAPLWETRSAATLMLVSAAALIILINATYQDGDSQHVVARPFRLGTMAAALALTPLTVMAAYALILRVSQYGWTTERIALAGCVIIALCYAGGYGIAIFRKGPWFGFIQIANFVTALAGVAVLLAFFSPIADPARISVASQMARLDAGKIAPEKFDFGYLRQQGGRFGKAALEYFRDHSSGPSTTLIAKRAKSALAGTYPMGGPVDLARNVTVYPKGKALPGSFTGQGWDKTASIVTCMHHPGTVCEAYLLDMDRDGWDEILFLGLGQNSLFAQQDGKWAQVGTLSVAHSCPGMDEALRKGNFTFRPSRPPRWHDIEINGIRLTIHPTDQRVCPPLKSGRTAK